MPSAVSEQALLAQHVQISNWIGLLVLGALLGVAGQSLRVVVGLKKRSDAAKTPGAVPEPFDAPRLLVSLLLGGAAGVLAVLSGGFDWSHDLRQQLMALVGAGYAGSDFLESAINRFNTSATTDLSPTPGA